MNIFKKLRAFFVKNERADLNERLARLERSYLILLKRLLELDGVQIPASKVAKFSDTVLQTTKDELNKGFNEPKPTIH